MEINGYKIIGIDIKKYSINNNTAITLMCVVNNIIEPFATITVNFDITLEEDLVFLDTNNCPWVEKFIEDYKLGNFANDYTHSGFCIYPLYKLNLERIKEIDKSLKEC